MCSILLRTYGFWKKNNNKNLRTSNLLRLYKFGPCLKFHWSLAKREKFIVIKLRLAVQEIDSASFQRQLMTSPKQIVYMQNH